MKVHMEYFSKNKYVRRAKISEYKFRKMVKYFSEDLSATEISSLIAINRNTVNRYLNEIRERIVEFCEQYAPFTDTIDEPPIDATANDIKAINSSTIQIISNKLSTNLDILKRRGKVYVEMLADCTTSKLRHLLQNKTADLKIMVHSIDIKEDAGMIAIGYDNNKTLANKPSCVANLDKFWQYIKERTKKFQGIAKHKYHLHLKESEFRFNFRNDNLYIVMLELMSAKPLT